MTREDFRLVRYDTPGYKPRWMIEQKCKFLWITYWKKVTGFSGPIWGYVMYRDPVDAERAIKNKIDYYNEQNHSTRHIEK